jgi:probable selenium-dependent hydroxylase accessory protein YqeC
MSSLSAWFEDFFFDRCDENTLANDLPRESSPVVATVIGSGGKTSLIWHLAASLSSKKNNANKTLSSLKILVTPTTKMFVPNEHLYDRYCDCRNGTAKVKKAMPGVTLAGVFNDMSGKLESLPLDELEKAVSGYDLVLIEGDGSKGLPLKAWTDNEPVVPFFTCVTIGLLPLWPMGQPALEKLIHRLPLFLELTGATTGETIKTEHILHLITGRTENEGKAASGGLFAKAKGKKVLFFNQVEDDNTLKQALEIVKDLPAGFFGGIIAGSVKENKAAQL